MIACMASLQHSFVRRNVLCRPVEKRIAATLLRHCPLTMLSAVFCSCRGFG